MCQGVPRRFVENIHGTLMEKKMLEFTNMRIVHMDIMGISGIYLILGNLKCLFQKMLVVYVMRKSSKNIGING